MPLLDNKVVELRCHPVLRVCELGLVVGGCSVLTARESRGSEGVGGVRGVGATGRCSYLSQARSSSGTYWDFGWDVNACLNRQ